MQLLTTRYFAVVAAVTALLGPIGLAQAQTDERTELLRGGASKKGVYNIFGLDGTGLGRTTVSYPSKYAPGTIVIDTAARQLYLIEGNGSALQLDTHTAMVGVGLAEQPRWLTDDNIYLHLPKDPAPQVLLSAIKRAFQFLYQKQRADHLEKQLSERTRELHRLFDEELQLDRAALNRHGAFVEPEVRAGFRRAHGQVCRLGDPGPREDLAGQVAIPDRRRQDEDAELELVH